MRPVGATSRHFRAFKRTHLVLVLLPLIHLVRNLPQPMPLGIRHGVVKVLVARPCEVAQRRGVPPEVVVDLVPLERGREGAEGAQEGEVLAGVL